jgi:nucleotide-binding universal stress UspA family protein
MDTTATTVRRHPVVVGVGSRRPTGPALTWAVEEATRCHRPLQVIHADRSADHARPTGLGAGGEPIPPQVVAVVSRARELSPGLEVAAEVSEGMPAHALTEASAYASCVVLGGHGRGSLAANLLGSTTDKVAVHALCPVIVVRGQEESRQVRSSVVVGVDGSALSAAAIGYAFAKASDYGLPLTVVHACPSRATVGYVPPWQAADPAARVESERAATAQEIAGWSGEFPDVRVNAHVLRGDPAAALVDHSREAALLVVGSRGFGGLGGRLVGSVSQAVVGRAHCPVAVVRSAGPTRAITE